MSRSRQPMALDGYLPSFRDIRRIPRSDGYIDLCGLANDWFQRALALIASFGCSVDQIVSNIFSCDFTSRGSLVHVATSWPAFTFVSSGMSSRKIISAESALARCMIGTVRFLTAITSASSLATLALVWFTGATTFTFAPL